MTTRTSGALPGAGAVGTTRVRNPCDGSTYAEVDAYGADVVAPAVATALAAQEDWAAQPPPVRARVLRQAVEVMRSRRDHLISDLLAEGGKPEREATGEVDKSLDTFDYYAGLGIALDGRTFRGGRPGLRHETRNEPVGLAVAITPWNVPIASPARKIAPALLAGDGMIIKPAELTPLSAINLVDALLEAGIPEGLVQVLTGPGRTVGQALVRADGVAAVSFTGSTAVGLGIKASLADRLTRLQLELGGKNAAVVFDDADLSAATRWIVSGAYAGAGQQCTGTSRALIHRPVLEQMLERLTAATAAVRVGSTSDPATEVGPLISAEHRDTVHGFVTRAVRAGAQLLVGGHMPDGPGFFYPPTLLTGAAPGSEIATSEVFGPVLLILPFGTPDEAIALSNETSYGLSAAVHTRDLERAERLAAQIDCGVVAVNGPTAGIEIPSPFGGFKQSGTESKEHGPEALRFYTRAKLVSWQTP